jgi:hypothetical protein
MKRLAVLTAIIFCVVAAMTGCPSSTAIHKASVSAASIGDSLQTAATVNHQMIQAGEETTAEGALVASYIDQAAKANDAFVKVLQATPDTGKPITAQQVLTAFNTLQQQIAMLNSQGVLHLKSAKAQEAFATVMTSIQTSIAAVELVIAANSSHNPILPGLPLLCLVLTPAEIEELIALAIAAGSALVTKLETLRGQTDAQLQNTALAADAAAEQQAEADEKQ